MRKMSLLARSEQEERTSSWPPLDVTSGGDTTNIVLYTDGAISLSEIAVKVLKAKPQKFNSFRHDQNVS